MLKQKTVAMMLVVALTLAFGAGVLAEGKTVYLEYEKEEDKDDYGPTLGIDWEANEQWTLSLGYQFEGAGENEAKTSLGAEYAIGENLSIGLRSEIADSEKKGCLELSGSRAINDPWALTGGVAYTYHWLDADDDNYEELELAAGVEFQATEALLTSAQYVWTDPSNDENSKKWVIGAEYGIDKYGLYFEYEIPDDGYKAKIGISYNF
jgi:opacity protein-like surface antigen